MPTAAAALVSKEALDAKVLVVGAGGIGCELLKNLVLTGFSNIDVVDLDTIDVSNLNRQFLFQKKHVGMSKAKVAAESVLRFAPAAKVTPHHGSIMNPEFSVDHFSQYSIVLNALDNRAARNHVNRMCLAAEVPLVESGSAGYLGQVTVIAKGVSECYECVPKGAAKSFPGCTIRNTPSEPIHCIVWAKHLFNQLFGEADIDEDVSPDASDPELQKAATADGETPAATDAPGGVIRVSTRKWAEDIAYEPAKLFTKLFGDDISYLLTMENLWKKRRAPTPLVFDDVPTQMPGGSVAKVDVGGGLKDKRVWSPAEARDVFAAAVKGLAGRVAQKEGGDVLTWDKDDGLCLDFVTATANLRNFIFGIALQSRFDVKSMAGNIIPAIATTNAIVAAMIVMEALKVISGRIKECKSIFVVRKPNPRGKILVDMELEPPRPNCFVCSAKPQAAVLLNLAKMSVKGFEDRVLKGELNFVAPDVNLDDGSGSFLISSEEGELTHLGPKKLTELKVVDGTRLICDDFMQKYELSLTVRHSEELGEEEFKLLTDTSDLKAEALEEKKEEVDEEDGLEVVEATGGVKRAAGKESPVPKKKIRTEEMA